MARVSNVSHVLLTAAHCSVLAFGAQTSPLVESANFLIIRQPADLTSQKLAKLQTVLFQAEQGKDNPHPSLVPVTIAFEPSVEPYDIGQLKMGYFTMLLGLGSKPDDVVIKGDFSLGDGINSVDNVFFKALVNLRLSGDLTWRTSQMCPLRSIHVDGSIDLGGGVGGLLVDSVVHGKIIDGGQQQYFFRNVSAVGGLSGRDQHKGQMNFVFLDSTVKTDDLADVCSGCKTCGDYYKAKQNPAPSFEIDSSTLPNSIQGRKAPLVTAAGVVLRHVLHTKLVHVKSQSDLENLAPVAGSVVVIHPGVYDIHKTLALDGDGIAVIGLGFPILRSALQDSTIKIAGSNCTLASLVVDAPLLSFNQDTLIDVVGAYAEIYDVTARTELAWKSPVEKVKTKTMLHIRAPAALVENIWLWRGDHWSGPDLEDKSFGNPAWDPYNINPYGLYVDEKANGVTCLAAFVEHQLWNPIVWNGDEGLLIMSQGECAYTNNGATSADVAGDVTPIPGLVQGIYYSVGATVRMHTYIGGGIYNIFGERFTQTAFPAMEILSNITEQININRCMIAGWVDTRHFESILRYSGHNYGPSLMSSSVSFYLCDLPKLLGVDPAPSPAPPECRGIECVMSDTDYWGNLPGWPEGRQKQTYDPSMSPDQCCAICAKDPTCAYWKEANGNCFYYENPSTVPREIWQNFTAAHPSSIWNVGIRDDVCCNCSAGGGATCGPTPQRNQLTFELVV